MSLSTPNRLSDFIRELSGDDADLVLHRFYEAAYRYCSYLPENGGDKWRLLLQDIRGYLPLGSKILDVGCGPGYSVKAMLEDGYDGYGVDFAALPQLWEREGLQGRCVSADAKNLPFGDGTFDLVLCNDMMEHIRDEAVPLVLKEIYRVGRKLTAISICLVEELSPVAGQVFTHITIKPAEWWREQLRSAGMDRFDEYETDQRLNIVHLR